MSSQIITNVNAGQVGQVVRATMIPGLNPPHYHWDGFYTNGVYSNLMAAIVPETGDGGHVQASSLSSNSLHYMTYARALYGGNGGGSFIVRLNSTQFFSNSAIGQNGRYAWTLRTPAGQQVARILYQYSDDQSTSFVILEDSFGGIAQDATPDYDPPRESLPVGTELRLDFTEYDFTLWVNGVYKFSEPRNTSFPFPLILRSEYWYVTGGTPKGTITFDPPELIGDWRPWYPEYWLQTTGYNAWSIVYYDASDNNLDSRGPIFVGVDAAGYPVADFSIDADVVGAAYVKIFYNATGDNTPSMRAEIQLDVEGDDEPPLVIIGPDPVEMLPGVQYPFQALNYTAEQLEFSPVGTPGFGTGATKHIFTAPTDAGSGTVTISVIGGVQSVDVDYVVLTVISPSPTSIQGGTSVALTINRDVTNFATTGWTADGGNLTSKAIRGVTYTAPANVGQYRVYATTAAGTIVAVINVTSSGTTTLSGLQLQPEAGYSGMVNNIVPVRMVGAPLTPVWATANNVRIDGANNNLWVLNNNGAAEAALANGFGSTGGRLKWVFTSSMLPDSIDDGYKVGWLIEDVNSNQLARAVFEYTMSGSGFNLKLYIGGAEIASEAVTATATTELDIENDGSQIQVRFRPDSGAGWTDLGSPFSAAGAVYLRWQYTPRKPSTANGALQIAKPTLSGGYTRWRRPQWFAELLDTGGSVIGNVGPIQTWEDSILFSGQRPQVADVTFSVAGRGRVRAAYPSGVVPENVIPLDIEPAGGTPFDLISPVAGSTITVDPGSTTTVTVNTDLAGVSFQAFGGQGSFGNTIGTRNIYTAPATSGLYYFLVSRGAEVKRVDVRVRLKFTPTEANVIGGGVYDFKVNFSSVPLTVGASGGSASILSVNADGTTTIRFNAPGAAGDVTVSATNPYSTATATAHVTEPATEPVEISTSSPYAVEPDATFDVGISNYPVASCTFLPAASFGAGGIRNRYTAPHTAGDHTITVQGPPGALSDTMVARVPLRIFPRVVQQLAPGQVVNLAANFSPTTEWRVQGAAGAHVGPTGVFTAPPAGGTNTVIVKATVPGVGVVTDSITIETTSRPLVINGGSPRIMQPGTTFDFTATQYTTAELTFGAGGGSGSFGAGGVANRYTAPADAGTYYVDISVTSNPAITQRIDITVPVVITPSSASVATGATQAFSINADVTNFATTGWQVDNGSLSSKAIRSVTYTAPGGAGTATLQVTTALGGVQAVPIMITSGAPALSISNGQAITLEGGRTHTVQANYTPAQLTYSLPAGSGSIDPATGVYTAPAKAGTYTLTVTGPGGSGSPQNVVFTVPYRVEPAAITMTPGQQFQFKANHPETTWSAGTGAGLFLDQQGNFRAAATPGGPFQVTATCPLGSATAAVTITAQTLIVYTPEYLEMLPGDTRRIETNLPLEAVSFGASLGFFGTAADKNLYTAPGAAGTHTITITAPGGQTRQVTVRVRLQITPRNVRMSGGGVQAFSANAGGVLWTVSSPYAGDPGTIDSSGFYQAPQGGPAIVRVRASTTFDSAETTIYFLAPFPWRPNYPLEGRITRRAALAETEDGTRFGRVKQDPKENWTLNFFNRHKDELLEVKEFFKARYPDGIFIFQDETTDAAEFYVVYFDSEITWTDAGPNQVDYSFRIREA